MPAIRNSLRTHWPEYLIEALNLCCFMISALVFSALLNHPGSPVHRGIPNEFTRRALGGLAMAVTAIGIIYSPWGRRSGAHMNPALTLTFLRLGKIQRWDAVFYMIAQVLGGLAGVLVSVPALGRLISHPSINYAVTVPGSSGAFVAFSAEAMISFGMMFMVLFATNSARVAPYTGLFAGMLIFLYITFESPFSGMSMNPARTMASAVPSGIWTGGWVYFTAPLLGMFLAAEVYRHRRGSRRLACPKFCHGVRQRCIFCGSPGLSRSANLTARPVSSCKVPASATTD